MKINGTGNGNKLQDELGAALEGWALPWCREKGQSTAGNFHLDRGWQERGQGRGMVTGGKGGGCSRGPPRNDTVEGFSIKAAATLQVKL